MATSHKRETARRTPRAALLAGSLAALATTAVVTGGVLNSSAPDADLVAVDRSKAAAGSVGDTGTRVPLISRSTDRSADAIGTKLDALLSDAATAQAIAGAKKSWTSTSLNLWTRPDKRAKEIGEIDEGERVLVTGRTYGERAEIVLDGKSRWVTAGYFTDEKPPTLGGRCTNGTSVSPGVSPSIEKIHEAVCANFPDISVYGTFRGASISGDHETGRAVDIMISGSEGWKVAEFVRANYAALGVSYIIYSQKIWSVERAGEGWRGMPNRGSATANHYDHVHVSVY
ncbi:MULTISPECIES: hypothetical protein [unclassified Nocardioides]|uniref:hypothetical protein n=1 Tax=unclassified Nocardioides TaxID=2615069 RepID=UPI001151BA4A|nr:MULTISPECIES: hypothetical protein [unclassified Nocardioides]TQK71823.1 hypothetical protein FBY23_3628 [Nocardioides sp. SLBN-35]WGY03981.1 hypothetical protein QI633_09455 [Nocardioides sp. QY071]